MTSPTPLTVSIQYAHHRHDELETLDNLGPTEVIAAYDRIDWQEQARQANRMQRVAPTFSVQSADSLLWVSVVGDPSKIGFVSCYSFASQVSRLFGLIKSRGTITRDREDLRPDQAREAIAAFASSDEARLAALFDT